MIELRWDAHGDGKVEMADPDAVHAIKRGDRLNALDSLRRLDFREEHDVTVGGAELGRRCAGDIAVVSNADGNAARAFRCIADVIEDGARFCGAPPPWPAESRQPPCRVLVPPWS